MAGMVVAAGSQVNGKVPNSRKRGEKWGNPAAAHLIKSGGGAGKALLGNSGNGCRRWLCREEDGLERFWPVCS